MKRNLILLFGFLTIFVFISCQKEYSAEINDTPANGSLQSDITKECLPKTVGGTFIAAKTLNDNNYIDVQINVTTPGAFTIATDTLNGYAFKTTGVFTDAGLKTVRLIGSGTPLSAGNNLFVVSFDTSFCLVQVVVLPAGAGGPANFTLQSSGADCLNYSVAGNYIKDTTLTPASTVSIGVNVTTIGTYNISTAPVNGITFTGSGTFSNTGAQTIILTASGKPISEETSTITITAGSSTCSFNVVVTATSVTADYYPRTANSNWSYEFDGNMNDSILRLATPLNHSAIGNSWNIFAETEDASLGLDSSGYYRRDGNDYFEFIDFGSFFGLDDEYWTEYIFLKDNQAVGSNWTSPSITGTSSSISVTVRIKATVLQKDADITVKGTSYPNTIVIEEKVEQFAASTWNDISSSVGYFKTYYSRNIGMIKKEYIGTTGQTESAMELRRHQVN